MVFVKVKLNVGAHNYQEYVEIPKLPLRRKGFCIENGSRK